MRFLLLLLLCALATGCLWGKNKKPKSSAHIYRGDESPTIIYSDHQERAGGLLNTN